MKKLGIIIVVFILIAALAGCLQTGKNPDVIKIGVLSPLSGPAALYGEMMKKGVDLAIDELNSKGGINGKNISVIYEDDQIDPKQGVAAFQKLITIEKVPAVIGPMGSSVVLAVAPIANQQKVVILSPTASAPDITNAGDYVFRNTPSDVYEGKETAKFAYNSLNLRKIAILYINNDYGVGLKDIFKNNFEQSGGIVTAMESFDPNSNDFRTQLSKIKETAPEAIYMIAYKESIQILKQITELGLDVKVLSVTPFQDPEVIEKAKGSAEGVIYAFVGYDPESKRKEVQDFNQAFRNKYGIDPDPSAAASYDAAKLIAFAIEKGGYSGEGIKNALYDIKDFSGVSGITSFDVNGDVVKPVEFRIIKNGKFTKYE